MADAHYKVQARIPMDSGLPNDAVVNTWHFVCEIGGSALTDAITALDDFYGDVASMLSYNCSFAGATYTAYDMSDPEPRAPVAIVEATDYTTGSTGAVPELALCLSFQGNRISGTPQARRRGRIYLGPLADITNTSTSPVVATAKVNQLKDAGAALLLASNTATDWAWVVYSVADNDTVTVGSGWVDNAFDIQRRRGLEATYRVTF